MKIKIKCDLFENRIFIIFMKNSFIIRIMPRRLLILGLIDSANKPSIYLTKNFSLAKFKINRGIWNFSLIFLFQIPLYENGLKIC